MRRAAQQSAKSYAPDLRLYQTSSGDWSKESKWADSTLLRDGPRLCLQCCRRRPLSVPLERQQVCLEG